MIEAYSCREGRLVKIEGEVAMAVLAGADWIDLVEPTPSEAALVTMATGLELPSRADLVEIESSSRLSSVGDRKSVVLTLSMPLVHILADGAVAAPLGLVLSPERLVTVRFAPSKVIDNLPSRVQGAVEPRSAGILVTLLEAVVDRQADALEQMTAEVDQIANRIFHIKLSPDGKSSGAQRRQQEGELREMLMHMGRLYNSISLVRDSQLGIGRIVPYVVAVTGWLPKPLNARLKTMARDVGSLNEFITHLTDKIQFVLDATLGLINIAQNDLMKVLTIVSVMGIPPTVVVGIYGMNFVNIPELHWHYGYFYALGVIVATAIAPVLWLRRRGWL